MPASSGIITSPFDTEWRPVDIEPIGFASMQIRSQRSGLQNPDFENSITNPVDIDP
jgi:hypothetical protein